MKLLIVDDQMSVVAGLLHGIDWNAMGFDKIDCAYNALDAKLSLEEDEADVMLCDIEMPMQNGLELLTWMRAQGITTRCIFLTSHAKFSYAQEAVRLGGFDYIIQPAPYSEIRNAVEKALEDVRAARQHNDLREMGTAFHQQRIAITSNTIRYYLHGQHVQRDMRALWKIGLVPDIDGEGHLICFQPLRWLDSIPWEGPLMTVALDNILREIFESYNEITAVSYLPKSECFAILLQNREHKELSQECVMRQMLFLESACRQYLNCITACYLLGPVPVNTMPQQWSTLLVSKEENVALKSGVFKIRDQGRTPHVFRVPQIRSWHNLLQTNCADAMEQEGIALLDELSEKGLLDSSTLKYFYQDFLQMLFRSMDGKEDQLNALFHEPAAMESYRNGMRSIDHMKNLIRHVARYYSSQPSEDDQTAIVNKVCQYIHAHLEEELRRDDLAEYVHLNPDYLTRIFKKEKGCTLKEYVIQQRMEEAQHLLRMTKLPINIIAAKVGYYNFSHFSSTYKRIIGKTPMEERQSCASIR